MATDEANQGDRSANRGRGRYQPSIGRDFEMLSRASIEYGTARTRDGIAYFALAVATAFLAAAAIYGAHEGNFDGLRDLWAVAGPIIGAILGYYFHRGRKD